MSVKISTRPRFGMGICTEETAEFIIDFETTGVMLDGGIDDDGIYRPPFLVIDVGIIGVDKDLNETFFIDTLVEHGSPQEALDQIAAIPVLVEMHTENGLVDDLERRVSGDAKGMTFDEIEDVLLGLIPDGGRVTLGGSGVASFDRPIIRKYMPELSSRLNFYPDDIGIERRSYRRATGTMLVTHPDDFAHRGFEDARTHLGEMRTFRDYHKRATRLIREEDARLAEMAGRA